MATQPMTFDAIQAKLAATDRIRWLGSLVWYGVSKVTVDHKVLAAALHRNGLTGYIPRPPSDVDVFKRVTTAASRKRVATNPNDSSVWANYLVRDLPSTGTHVQKVLVREVVNADDLEYEVELLRFELEKTTGNLSITRMHHGDLIASDIAQEVTSEYALKRKTMNSYAVRECLRKIVHDCHGTNVRGKGGGVYFVAESYAETIDRAGAFAASMPGTVLFHSLPLIDDGLQRDMIKRAFESETVDEIKRVIGELDDMMKSGTKITPEKAAIYTQELKDLKAKTAEYQDLLQDTTDMAKSHIALFQRQVLKVLSMVNITDK